MDFVNRTLHFSAAIAVKRTKANSMIYCIGQDHSRSQEKKTKLQFIMELNLEYFTLDA
jgi:hypothetical protein